MLKSGILYQNTKDTIQADNILLSRFVGKAFQARKTLIDC